MVMYGHVCYLAFCLTDCLRVTTGNVNNDHGTLEVIVNGLVSSRGYYAVGDVVLDKCFASLDKVEVRNHRTNGWVGTVSVSTDGGKSYRPLLDCPTCVSKGNSDRSGVIGVDGDDNMHAKIACINGATCELLLRRGLQILHGILLATCVHAYVCMYVWTYGCMDGCMEGSRYQLCFGVRLA